MAKNKGKKDSIDIEDIEIEDEAPAQKKGKSRKAKAEAAPAAESKKSGKGKQPEQLKRELPEGYVSAEQLAEEFGKKGRDVRQVLRDNEIEKPENGRWAWHEKKDASTLKRIRALLGGAGGKKKEKAEEAPAKKGKGKKEPEATPETGKKKKGKK